MIKPAPERPVLEPFPSAPRSLADQRAWVLLDTDDRRRERSRCGDRLGAAQQRRAARPRRRRRADRRSSSRRRVPRCRSTCGRSTDGTSWPSNRPAQPAPRAPTPAHLAFVADIEAAGATVVVEHGVVTGEVRGLEVCRVVDVADREVPRGARGRRRTPRSRGLRDHPRRRPDGRSPRRRRRRRRRRTRHLTRQGTRSTVLRPSGSCGGGSSRSRGSSGWRRCTTPSHRCHAAGLKHRAPCTAVGYALDGTPAVIVCSVGVDLDVIPYAADARLCGGRRGAGGNSIGGDVRRPSGARSPTGDQGAGEPAPSLGVVGGAVAGLIAGARDLRRRPRRRR